MACVCCVSCDCRQLENFYGQTLFITFGTFSGNGNGSCDLSGQTVTLTYCASCGDFGGPAWTGTVTVGDQTFNITVHASVDDGTGSVEANPYWCLRVEVEYTVDGGSHDGEMTGLPPAVDSKVVLDQCEPTLGASGDIDQIASTGDPFTDPCKGESATFSIYS